MAYSPPVVTSAGLSIPSYTDILNYLTTNFQSIYGQNVYLGNDSADFQFISILALAISDAENAVQLAYNNTAPNFAIGAGLSSLVKLNGLNRKVATYSTAVGTVTGAAGAVINNGVVQDVNGNLWNLPASVTIGGGGTVSVVVRAQQLGAINAAIGQISVIATPTSGWTGFTNTAAAAPGVPVETDSQLRARQAVSTELTALTTLDAAVALILTIPGVTRINWDNNTTGSTDGNGVPAHSVAFIVEGGSDDDVAASIYYKLGIGPGTFGSTTVNVTDFITQVVSPINFSRPTLVPIFVTIDVTALTNYTSDTTAAIVTALTNYLNALQIGQDLTISGLEGAALAVMPDLTKPLFSITDLQAGLSSGTESNVDIPIAFDEVTQGVMANIVINVS